MQQFKQFLLTIILTTCSHRFLYAQVNPAIVSGIKVYSKQVDSLSKLSLLYNNDLMSSVSEGIIKTGKKIDGGFGLYTFSNQKGDSVFRIEYHENIDINIYKTYYFKHNNLILSKVILQEGNQGLKIIYRKEEIYEGNVCIWTNTIKEKGAERYLDKVNFSMFDDGMASLTQFLKNTHNSK